MRGTGTGDHWKAGVVIRKNDGHREEGRGTEREHGGQQTDVLVSLGGGSGVKGFRKHCHRGTRRSGEGRGLLKMRCFPLHVQSWGCRRYRWAELPNWS